MAGRICSRCGGTVRVKMILTDPPVTIYTCARCGAERRGYQEITPQVIQMDDQEGETMASERHLQKLEAIAAQLHRLHQEILGRTDMTARMVDEVEAAAEALEDEIDVTRAEAVLAKDEPTIPLAEVKRELGIED